MLFLFIPLFIWYWTDILVLNDDNHSSFYRLGGKCVTGKFGVVIYFLYSLALFVFTLRTSVTLSYQTAIQTMMLSYAILRIPLFLISADICVEILSKDCQEFTTILRNTGTFANMGLSRRVRVTPLRRNQKSVGIMVEECVIRIPDERYTLCTTHLIFFGDLQGTIHIHHIEPMKTNQTLNHYAYTSSMSGDFAYSDPKCLCVFHQVDGEKKYVNIQLK